MFDRSTCFGAQTGWQDFRCEVPGSDEKHLLPQSFTETGRKYRIEFIAVEMLNRHLGLNGFLCTYATTKEIAAVNKASVSEAAVYGVTTAALGSVNLEYFFWRAIGNVNCKYCDTVRNVLGIHERYNSQLEETKNYLLKHAHIKPKIGMICGTGLDFVPKEIEDPIVLPYESIPNFPICTTKGHTGNLILGYVADVPIMCMQGRFHYFEGYSSQECSMPIRVMKMMGVTHVILSNSAGGINPKFKTGNIMLIKDHINFIAMSGANPLRGPNLDNFGTRFPSMTDMYNKKLIKHIREVAKDEDFENDVCEGIYACVGGPSFETVSEIRMLKIIGADAVGMSTANEVIAARHCNMVVFAFSIITNMCVTSYDASENPDHDQILDVAKTKEHVIKRIINNVVQYVKSKQ
ncbi:hypothetical protein FQA39_LY04060 [Lamprigera yunnana]|nr:hypothetical protein FQA39_LY04060 [Lamprigera yunnana]